MDPFTIFVGVVSILGVAWMLFIGSQTIHQVLTDARRRWAERVSRPIFVPQSPTDLKPLVTLITTYRADLLQQIQQLEQHQREVQQKLARLEMRSPQSPSTSNISAHLERIRSGNDLGQDELAHFQSGTTGQFVKTQVLVDRQRELEMIRKALLDSHHLRVLYFYGEGGVGKTRLLEEAGRLVESPGSDEASRGVYALLRKVALWRRQPLQSLAWCGVVDLYHTDLHDSLSVQQAIIAALDPNEIHFQDYRRLATEYRQARRERVDSHQVEALWEKLAEAFDHDYDELAATKRVVLAFDTLETIQHETSIVKEVCQIKPDPMAVEGWLLRDIGRLENSVVLLASRPRDDLLSTFEKAYPTPEVFESRQLTGLTWGETQDYIRLLVQQRPEIKTISKEVLWRLYRVTEGLPVRLALALDLMLDQEAEVDSPSSDQVDAVLGRNLFSGIEHDEPLMFYLALARRGLDAELLHYLKPEWSVDDCNEHLIALKDLAYVKIRPGATTLFLHDELYTLFDQFGPERSRICRWYARISEYYHKRQEELDAERGREAWRQATANWLYYQLRATPSDGYQSYMRLAEEAVKGHDFRFDMRLRDEVLWFFQDRTNMEIVEQSSLTREVVDRDSTLLWVRRYIEKGQYATACQVVRNIYESDAPLFDTVEPLFYATLDTYYGEAKQYLGQAHPEALQTLNQAVDSLNPLKFSDKFKAWWHARVLGRALNNIGYVHRQRQCYSRAAEAFQSATLHFQSAGVKDELADTLNNLAFVFGMLGQFAEAEQEAHKALELRRRLGQRYPLALSLNTLGLIHLGAGRLEEARKQCADALNIFEELNATRGQGLAFIALGQIYRQMARWCTEAPEAITLLRDSDSYLKQAINIFEEQIHEPLRLVEATNESGCTCRDAGRWAEQSGQPQIAQDYYQNAQAWLERSITVNEERWPALVADSCEDMARLFLERGLYVEARQWLEQAEEAVPEVYYLQEGKGFTDLQESVEGFWLALGKIHLLRGHMTFALFDTVGDLRPSLEQYMLALSYLQKYSVTVPAFQRARSEIYQRLNQLPTQQKEQARQSASALAESYRVSADCLSALLS